jgi:hypothetical protein
MSNRVSAPMHAMSRLDSEPVNESVAPERRDRAAPIEAQSTAISLDTASIRNEERGRQGTSSV